ncbi:MAG: efflux RND transporter permease subunit, partial [candidate division WOR-3 bacterium]
TGIYLPDDAQKPFMLKFDVSMMPVINITLSGNISETELREIAEDVSTQLQRIAGVAAVGVAGGVKNQVQINVDLREMANLGITFDQIVLALKAQNINFPVGSVQTEEQKFIVRLVGQYENLEDIRNTIIGKKGTAPVLLRQIADVSWTAAEQVNYTRLNQKNAIFMWVQRRPDANTILVVNNIKNEIKKIKNTLPSSVNLNVFWDSSEIIKRSVKNVAINLILGGL